jgi:hypothetical protein
MGAEGSPASAGPQGRDERSLVCSLAPGKEIGDTGEVTDRIASGLQPGQSGGSLDSAAAPLRSG